ncbi:MAG: protoporphyrinogen oxidase HemJ [Saprospiraceae bacterium]|nr:protoporphyrinogen oxidase HemJ [Saprospiraceae bacterium]
MTLLVLKTLHIIGFVAWFAALFYLVRLFVYHAEAFDKVGDASTILARQYALMERRLFSMIATPAMVLTLIGGIGMLIINPGYFKLGWMHLKLTLVVLLIIYHHLCIPMMKKLQDGTLPMSPMRFRFFNEVPTILLVATVALAVFQSMVSYLTLLLVILGLVVFIVAATMGYKRFRQKKAD